MQAAYEASRRSLLTIALVALATLFMLQGMRVFVGYLVFVVDQSERVALASIALAVFLSPALILLLIRLLPHRRILMVSLGLLVGSRAILQVWQQPEARLVLGALCITGWGWLVLSLVDRQRVAVGLGVLVALPADIMVRMGSQSIDLPWMPGMPAHLLTLILIATLVVCCSGLFRLTDAEIGADVGCPLTLLGVGPALVLHVLATGNLALGHANGEGDRSVVWVAMLAGIALGLFIMAIATMFSTDDHRPLDVWVIAGASVAGAAGLWMTWTGDPPGSLWIVMMVASGFILTASILLGRPVELRTPAFPVTFFTAGLVLLVGLIFAYYTFTGLGIILAIAWVLMVPLALWSKRLPSIVSPPASTGFGLVSRIGVLLVFILPVMAEISAVEPEASPVDGAELTVMVYNIQAGFAKDRTWDLRRTAEVIAAEQPDILVLNEVSRDWLVTASSDHLIWLSRELEMPFVWGPASGDDLWGNAIFSKVPLDQSDTRKFASTQNLKRSVAGIAVTVNDASFWVFGTHLDDPRGAGEARMEQVQELISFQEGRSPGIIMGDFNAEPEDDVLQELLALGFTDPVTAALPGATTSQDERRIDYILVSEGIEVLDVWIPDVDASDHKPVVARIRVGD